MKLEAHQHIGATIQQLMAETRQLENFIVDRNDRHMNTRRGLKLLSRSWLLLEAARFELEEALSDQHQAPADTGIYRPAPINGRLLKSVEKGEAK